MAFVRTAMKAGIARKIWRELRKPENQAKARELVRKANEKRTRRSGTPRSATQAGGDS